MTSETDAEFVADMEWLHSHDREAALPPEKLDRLFALARRGAAMDTKPQTSSETVREDEPKGFMAGWLLGRADAAKVLDDMPCAPSQGIHDYWAGYRAALTYGAVHIRALPPPPAGEQTDE